MFLYKLRVHGIWMYHHFAMYRARCIHRRKHLVLKSNLRGEPCPLIRLPVDIVVHQVAFVSIVIYLGSSSRVVVAQDHAGSIATVPWCVTSGMWGEPGSSIFGPSICFMTTLSERLTSVSLHTPNTN